MRNNLGAIIPTLFDDDIYGDCDSDTFEWELWFLYHFIMYATSLFL